MFKLMTNSDWLISDVTLTNEDVFLNTTFGDLVRSVILLTRGDGPMKKQLEFEAVKMKVNKMDIW